jgi:hypothetical protein
MTTTAAIIPATPVPLTSKNPNIKVMDCPLMDIFSTFNLKFISLTEKINQIGSTVCAEA